jgi:biopolymer transport protein ExbD
MKHLVEINDRSKAGKSLLQVIKTMSAQSNDIVFIGQDEEVPFEEFAVELKKAVAKRFTKTKSSKK